MLPSVIIIRGERNSDQGHARGPRPRRPGRDRTVHARARPSQMGEVTPALDARPGRGAGSAMLGGPLSRARRRSPAGSRHGPRTDGSPSQKPAAARPAPESGSTGASAGSCAGWPRVCARTDRDQLVGRCQPVAEAHDLRRRWRIIHHAGSLDRRFSGSSLRLWAVSRRRVSGGRRKKHVVS